MTKTRTVELPSDSIIAIAMKNQQQAEREEQQRIKNLVLNYDLREQDDQDGDHNSSPLSPNSNIHAGSNSGNDKPTSHHHNRQDKPSRDRGGQRVRKLQLSDVDWYGKSHRAENQPRAAKVDNSPQSEVVDASSNKRTKRGGTADGA